LYRVFPVPAPGLTALPRTIVALMPQPASHDLGHDALCVPLKAAANKLHEKSKTYTTNRYGESIRDTAAALNDLDGILF